MRLKKIVEQEVKENEERVQNRKILCFIMTTLNYTSLVTREKLKDIG